MIISENITVKIQLPITATKITSAFNERGIEPLRWAIVSADAEVFTINVSYEQLAK